MAYKIKNKPVKEKKSFAVSNEKGRFKINDKIEIVCKWEKARDGFRHRATLFINGQEKESTTTHYINRTWESYEFQSVMQKLVDKSTYLTPQEKQFTQKWLKGDRTDWSDFKMTKQVAQLGDVFCKTQKEKNDWKARMLKAGLGNRGLSMPDDWDKLSENEKEKRLNKVIGVLGEKK
ncbi:MAG TPA: hypothetical protein VMZ91_13480 [Candidatus Paceibacterota bacterium]|nr:hypothetical protein [Candidatus Paceibacterota bacterium]